MLDFLRRLPELLGLKRKAEATPAAKPAGASQPKRARSADGPAKQPRGRGTGRGITPPGKPKGSPPRRSAKK